MYMIIADIIFYIEKLENTLKKNKKTIVLRTSALYGLTR